MWNLRRWLWILLGLAALAVWTFAVWTDGIERGRKLGAGLPPLRSVSRPTQENKPAAVVKEAPDAGSSKGARSQGDY